VVVEGKTMRAEVGTISLIPEGSADYAFRLGDLYPESEEGGGWTGLVPPFSFTETSSSRDLPGFTEASIAAGLLTVRIRNGLPVPLGGTVAPEKIEIDLVDPEGGSVVVAIDVDGAIAPGDSALVPADLAGVDLPDSLYAILAGGSPGSGLSEVDVDPEATVEITARPGTLEVTRAVAPVGAEAFGETSFVALPDSVRVAAASIESGRLAVALSNNLPLPVDVEIELPSLFEPGGAALSLFFSIEAEGSASSDVDLAGYTLDLGGEAVDSLAVRARASTGGSAGELVSIEADDALVAAVDSLSLLFSSVTGVLDRRQIDLDTTKIDLEIPEELESIALSRARLVVTMRSEIEIPGSLAVHLEGVSEGGAAVGLDVSTALAAAAAGSTTAQEIVLDETNSDLVPFLNNLPVGVTGTGRAFFGDGVSEGTVKSEDAVSAEYAITTPLVFSLDAQTIEIDPEKVDLDDEDRADLEDHLIGALLDATVRSTFPVGVRAWVLFGTDSSRVFDSPALTIGPFDVSGAGAAPDSGSREAASASERIELDEEGVRVLALPDLYEALRIEVPGTEGVFVEVLDTDRIEAEGVVRGRVRIGGEE